MKCPNCGGENFSTVDSRWGEGLVRRRRECRSCFTRFNTIEITELEYNKIKRQNRQFEEIADRFRKWDFDVGEQK